MRRLALLSLLALTLAPSLFGANAGIVNVSTNTNTNLVGVNGSTPTLGCGIGVGGTQTDYFFCYPDTTLSGNEGFVWCNWGHNGTTTASVTDDGGNTYTSILKEAHAGGQDLEVYKATLTTAAHQLKLHFTAARGSISCGAWQLHDTDGTLDGVAVGTTAASGTTLTAGSITASFTNSLYIQVFIEDDADSRQVYTAGSGFTLKDNRPRENIATQYQSFASTGSHTCSMTTTASIAGPSICVAFKTVAGGTQLGTFGVVSLFQYPMRDGVTSVAFGAPCAEPGANGLIVVMVNTGGPTQTVSSVALTNPTLTLTLAGSNTAGSEGNIYNFFGVSGSFASNTQGTVTLAAANVQTDMVVYCVQGAAQAGQPDVAFASFTTTDSTNGAHSINTATLTPNVTPDIFFGSCGIATNGTASGSPPSTSGNLPNLPTYQDNQNNNNYWGHAQLSSSQTAAIWLDTRSSSTGGGGAISCGYTGFKSATATSLNSPTNKQRKLEVLESSI